jgi:hypothetical protein
MVDPLLASSVSEPHRALPPALPPEERHIACAVLISWATLAPLQTHLSCELSFFAVVLQSCLTRLRLSMPFAPIP